MVSHSLGEIPFVLHFLTRRRNLSKKVIKEIGIKIEIICTFDFGAAIWNIPDSKSKRDVEVGDAAGKLASCNCV